MLSKSKYCIFTQCPRALWLKVNRPELAAQNPALEARFEKGNEIGDLAMGIFGDFVEVTSYTEDGTLDLEGMIQRTSALVESGEKIICEASFSYKGNYCAVDILKKESGGYAIYEVKSSTHVNPVYITDIAYQKYVLEKCGINVTGTNLICINNNYVFNGELDLSKFFKITDLSAEVSEEYRYVEENIAKAFNILELTTEPVCEISENCSLPYACQFWDHCAAHIPTPSVFSLYRMNYSKALEYYNRDIVTFEDLLQDDILKNKIRSLQVEHTLLEKETHVDVEGIRNFLSTLSFPLYFLDFETIQPIVPQFFGTKPYAQIPFQYSLHYMESADDQLKHKEFLAVSGEDPRRAIAERLCADIPRNVCVLAYNKNFECSRIRELAAVFLDLSEHLLNIASNIKDLIDPFRNGFYYNRAMGNSFSIKNVLPAIYPDDPSLDYHNLEGVHNGSEAMAIFPLIKDMPPEEQDAARQNLLKYCELDTYAMVKVWEELVRVTE